MFKDAGDQRLWEMSMVGALSCKSVLEEGTAARYLR